MRLIFMGTPHFAVPALQVLLHTRKHEVVAVYSQPPRPAGRGQKLTPGPVHQLAETHGISVHTPISLRDAEAQALFASHAADVAVVAAYGLLLPQAILDTPTHGCINIHPSDLPRWRGAAPLQRTIMAGDATTALCIMQMEAGLDTGPVMRRAPFTIAPGMSSADLHDRMAHEGAEQLLLTLDDIANGTATRIPQSTEGVTYASKLSKAESAIDWNLPARDLYHRILGLNPAPAATMVVDGEVVKLLRAEIVECFPAQPGTVLTNDGVIACGEGALKLVEIQRPNKRPMLASEALHGWHLAAGMVLD